MQFKFPSGLEVLREMLEMFSPRPHTTTAAVAAAVIAMYKIDVWKYSDIRRLDYCNSVLYGAPQHVTHKHLHSTNADWGFSNVY